MIRNLPARRSFPLFLISFLLPLPLFAAPPASPSWPTAREARQQFEVEDREMNVGWNSAKKALPFNEYRILQESQRRWATTREQMASSPVFTGTGGTESHKSNTAPYLQTAADITHARAHWLKGLAHLWTDKSLTGVWSDGEGGRLELLLESDRLHFSFEIVRGIPPQIGKISGVAFWNERLGWFNEKSAPLDPRPQIGCSICFVLKERRIEITSSGSMGYHDKDANFDGNYYKTQELSAERQKELRTSLMIPLPPALVPVPSAEAPPKR
jgi:uncharacterized protein YecT (DUF1311 family)